MSSTCVGSEWTVEWATPTPNGDGYLDNLVLSFVLPWTITTLKDDLYILGQQGPVTDEFTEQVTSATISYLDSPEAADPA